MSTLQKSQAREYQDSFFSHDDVIIEKNSIFD